MAACVVRRSQQHPTPQNPAPATPQGSYIDWQRARSPRTGSGDSRIVSRIPALWVRVCVCACVCTLYLNLNPTEGVRGAHNDHDHDLARPMATIQRHYVTYLSSASEQLQQHALHIVYISAQRQSCYCRRPGTAKVSHHACDLLTFLSPQSRPFKSPAYVCTPLA